MAALLLSGAPLRLMAQEVAIPVASELEDYLRLLEVQGQATGPLTFRSLSTNLSQVRITDTLHQWAGSYPLHADSTSRNRIRGTLFSPQVRVFFNSDHPYGVNDGALWAGRGLNADLNVGDRKSVV